MNRVLPPLRRTAADAEAFARVVPSDHFVGLNNMIAEPLAVLRAAVERGAGR